ncbi:MAG: hypothetical protein KME64_09970 [Scytonematopsis contorta HA4267-MV1]|nr:hypothetical protein [Scytonematopsis contorta HA4267-MV1]
MLAKVKYKNRSSSFLIHVEAQSYSKSKPIFPKRMFKYFGRLYEKYDLPIYPIVIFSFDKPKRAEAKTHSMTFPDLDVLQFKFAAIQLNRLNWRDYLTQKNPVAAALMSKMNIPVVERPQAKLECLRLLATLKLDPARVKMISGFVDTYLQLNAKEEKVFQAEISKIGLDEREEIMEIVTSWERKGKKEGKKEGKQEALEQVAINALRQGMVVDLIVQITGLTKKQVLALQAQLSQDS